MLMLKKKKNTIISLALAVILGAFCYYYFAIYNSVRDVVIKSDYMGFSTAESLFSNAELVVIGSPVKDYDEREVYVSRVATGALEDIVTFTEIDVEKVLKGPEVDGIDLEVIEPMGVYQTLTGKERIAFDGYTAMKKGSRYLIFLSKNTLGQYGVINMQFGKFNLDQTDPEDMAKDNLIKQRIFTELKSSEYLQ